MFVFYIIPNDNKDVTERIILSNHKTAFFSSFPSGNRPYQTRVRTAAVSVNTTGVHAANLLPAENLSPFAFSCLYSYIYQTKGDCPMATTTRPRHQND